VLYVYCCRPFSDMPPFVPPARLSFLHEAGENTLCSCACRTMWHTHALSSDTPPRRHGIWHREQEVAMWTDVILHSGNLLRLLKASLQTV
jgi:hypothetical protein